MSHSVIIALLAAVLALVAAGWALYARALRVDRLHRQVLGSRATVEAQLVHRAQAAADLAASGLLDPAASQLLGRAAHQCLATDGPLVDDGLASRQQWGLDQLPDQGRAGVESDLTQVLRTVLGPQERARLAASASGAQHLARVERTAYRLVLARRFHNTHVEEARRLRVTWIVRLAHLAGRAALPQTFDMDDDLDLSYDPAPTTSAQETP